ncbi:hypothetical protein MKW92_038661, partial [Papaver armeniacum]
VAFLPTSKRTRKDLSCLRLHPLLKLATLKKVVIGMDVAAAEFYGSDKTYGLNFKEENNNGATKISGEKLKDLYKSFAAEYPRID